MNAYAMRYLRRLSLIVSLGVACPSHAKQAPEVAPSPTSSGVEASANTAKLNINTATLEQLMTLPGIGEKRAQAILARRAQKPFRRVSELRQIKGIGRRTLARLQSGLEIGDAKETPSMP